MHLILNKWVLLLVNLGVTFAFFVANAPVYSLLQFINTLFYITFIYLMLGLLFFTIRGKFFDPIVDSFRKVIMSFKKNRDYLEELEYKAPSERISKSFTDMLFFQGIFLLLIMLILLFIYYM